MAARVPGKSKKKVSGIKDKKLQVRLIPDRLARNARLFGKREKHLFVCPVSVVSGRMPT
jgi:hypothetical protein